MNDSVALFEYNILHHLPLGCCILNSDMKIIQWNVMLCNWTGLSTADVLYENIGDIFPHLRKAQYNNRFLNVLESGSPAVFSSVFTRQLFTCVEPYLEQYQQSTITRVEREKGDYTLSIIVNDVTEQRQRIQQYKSNAALRAEHESILTDMNKRLENNNSYLDEFAHVVSHDLKAPLRNINSLLSWLIEDLGNDLGDKLNDSITEYIDKLKQTTSGMNTLIDSLLSYARAGHEQGEIEAFNVRDLCDHVCRLNDIPDHIRVHQNGTDCSSQSSKLLLGQVIGNILSNAIKYNDKESGCIDIVVSQEKNKHIISIKDNGPGIDQKYHEKIFQIFQKAHHDTRQDSTGIGLALVKKIIENQGETLYVTSEMGVGSEFTFSWPILLEL